MKKTVFAVLLFTLIFSLPFSVFAEEAVDTAQDAQAHDHSGQEVLDIEHFCFCGREFYTEDGDGHYKYDCVKCNKNMYLCTCSCWCGASSVWDTSGNWGSIIPLICSGCEKPCLLCDCAEDKEAILQAEQLRQTGQITPLNVSRPEGGGVVFLSVILTAAVFAALTVLDSKGIFDADKIPVPLTAEHTLSEGEPEDTVSDDDENIPETAQEDAPVKKPTVEKASQDFNLEADGSFAVYEMTNEIMFKINRKTDKSPMYAFIADMLIANDGSVKRGNVHDVERWCEEFAAPEADAFSENSDDMTEEV